MEKVAIHSHKGGVGKTTIALLLAKYAVTQGMRPCVLDFDFIGSGMANLLAWERKPSKYVEDYFFYGAPHEFDVKSLLGLYMDSQVRPHGVEMVLNSGIGFFAKGKVKAQIRQEDAMMGMVANEPYYQVIRTNTAVLFELLERHGCTMAIVDCHPGLGLVSETVRPIVDLNIYVATQNRSDCFGLLKEVNLRQLDNPRSLLVLNRAESPVTDLASLRRLLQTDKVVGPAGEALLSNIKHMTASKEYISFINESEELRRTFYLGSKAALPRIDPESPALDCCRKARVLLSGKR